MKNIPDTSVVNEAFKEVRAALCVNILNHSMRTYHYGCEFGEQKKIVFSEEELILFLYAMT